MDAKILIVEDEPDIRDTLNYNFDKEGFKVLSSPNGKSALKLLEKHDPDIVILDLMLPDISGLDLCRQIKNDKKLSNTSIIMLTAKSEEVDRIVGFELGADDYVTKPFSVRELILRVKVLMKKHTSSEDTDKSITLGSIYMNLDAHEVQINKEDITLTALEFKLLKHLLLRKGRVQTRDQLLGDVWGYSSEVTTRTVDTHIKRLREKLGVVADYIQTIRGVGYKFTNAD
ncbi:MAG: DNA-binding response regulator [Rickettsiales bacterium]|nr:DNA-binding response regulator [Rickettsiales bacterium]